MSKRKKLLGIICIILAVALLLCAYTIYNNSQNDKAPKKTSNGPADSASTEFAACNITIRVCSKDGTETVYEVSTHDKYLSDAMDEAEGLTYSGSNGAYGMMLEVVNGEKAIYEEDGAYWSILVDGEYGMNGIDSQPVEDGVEYSLVYTLA